MSEPKFFQTRMGQRFYEHTMPELVRQLERLNDRVGQLVPARRDPAVQELIEYANDFCEAAEKVMNVEIAPGSPADPGSLRVSRRLRGCCAAHPCQDPVRERHPDIRLGASAP